MHVARAADDRPTDDTLASQTQSVAVLHTLFLPSCTPHSHTLNTRDAAMHITVLRLSVYPSHTLSPPHPSTCYVHAHAPDIRSSPPRPADRSPGRRSPHTAHKLAPADTSARSSTCLLARVRSVDGGAATVASRTRAVSAIHHLGLSLSMSSALRPPTRVSPVGLPTLAVSIAGGRSPKTAPCAAFADAGDKSPISSRQWRRHSET